MPTIINQESGHHYGMSCIKHGVNLMCVKDNMKDALDKSVMVAYGYTHSNSLTLAAT